MPLKPKKLPKEQQNCPQAALFIHIFRIFRKNMQDIVHIWQLFRKNMYFSSFSSYIIRDRLP